jgi:hypothetical protein
MQNAPLTLPKKLLSSAAGLAAADYDFCLINSDCSTKVFSSYTGG